MLVCCETSTATSVPMPAERAQPNMSIRAHRDADEERRLAVGGDGPVGEAELGAVEEEVERDDHDERARPRPRSRRR